MEDVMKNGYCNTYIKGAEVLNMEYNDEKTRENFRYVDKLYDQKIDTKYVEKLGKIKEELHEIDSETRIKFSLDTTAIEDMECIYIRINKEIFINTEIILNPWKKVDFKRKVNDLVKKYFEGYNVNVRDSKIWKDIKLNS